MPNPFGSTFESFGAPRGPLVETVHQKQFQSLTDLLDSGEGQLISLRAPRAGYGKTMLLSRLRQARQSQALFVPVHLADGRRVEGEFILEEILTQITEVLPAGGGLTRLDLHTRKLFAQGLMPMVYSGEVPCQDREGALASLRDRPTEAFDFHHEGAAIAQWSREQFGALGPRLSAVLSKASGTSGRDVGYWADLFFNYAIRPSSDVSRAADLMDAVFGERSRFHSGAGFLEGLGSFLNLITLVEPIVLVLDEVEGLSSDSDAALRAASCLTSLWEAAPRVSVIISVNDDVWDSAFAPRLPLGLRDRLEDVVVRLDALTLEEAKALITIRAGDEAEKVIARVDLDAEVLYPRGLLREAREVWNCRDEAMVDAAVVEEPKASMPVEVEEKAVRAPAPMVQYHRREPVVAEPEPVVSEEVASEEVAEVKVAELKVEPAAVSPVSQFGTHPSAKFENDLSLDDDLSLGDDFAQPSQVFEVAKKAVYPPASVSRVTLPRRFMVQRLVPAIMPRLQAQSVASFEEVVQPVEPVQPPQEVALFAESAPVVEPLISAGSPVSGGAESGGAIASPFAINPNPNQEMVAGSLPPARASASPRLATLSPFSAHEGAQGQASEASFEAPVQAPVVRSPFEAPVQVPVARSPFEVASQGASQVEAPVQVPVAPSPFEIASQGASQVEAPVKVPVARSPFGVAAQGGQQAEAQVPVAQSPFSAAPEAGGQVASSASEVRLEENADAIDDLLRQFRERKGS